MQILKEFDKLRRHLATGVLGLALMAGASVPALAQELRVSSFEPPQGFYSAEILSAWIERVAPQLSAGTSLRLYPGAILGAPPAQQELVKQGVADVALVVPTYTPGLFPRSSVVEVPYIAPTAEIGTNILQTLLEEGLLGEEYDDFKIIGLFTTHGYQLIVGRNDVRTPDEVTGFRIRTPSPFVTNIVEMFGASGVSIPAPQVYESLERGVVDAALWNFDAYTTFRLNEPAPHVTLLGVTSSPMAILMNKQSYERLSEADRAVIDASSGRAFSEWVADVIDSFDQAQQLAFAEEISITVPNAEEARLWRDALLPAQEVWLNETGGLSREEAEPILARALELSGN